MDGKITTRRWTDRSLSRHDRHHEKRIKRVRRTAGMLAVVVPPLPMSGIARIGTHKASQLAAVSHLKKVNPVRQDLVERVRAEIAAGTYDTDAKVDALLNSLAIDLT